MDMHVGTPMKTREMQIFCIDSTYWDNFKFRDDDIIISHEWMTDSMIGLNVDTRIFNAILGLKN